MKPPKTECNQFGIKAKIYEAITVVKMKFVALLVFFAAVCCTVTAVSYHSYYICVWLISPFSYLIFSQKDGATKGPKSTKGTEPTKNPTSTKRTEPTKKPTSTKGTEPTKKPTSPKGTEPTKKPTSTKGTEPTKKPTSTKGTEPTKKPTSTKGSEPTKKPTTTKSQR